MEHILVLRILYLYYGSSTCITELMLIYSDFLYFGSYTCITELMLVFRISCILDLILVLWSLCLYFGFYTCITELMLVFRILFLYSGTYSYTKVPVDTISPNISKLYQIHTSSDQTYADTNISP